MTVTPDPNWEKMTREEKDKILAGIQEENRLRDLASYEAQQAKALDDSWEKLCPPIYRDPVEMPRLKCLEGKARLIMEWRYNPTGMIITGLTGQGKTRCSWHALKRAHYQGRRIIALDGIMFANEAGAAAYSPDATEKWMKRLSTPDILFIDDLAKRFTKTSGQLLFGLIERRTSNRLPLIVTTNLTAPQLESLIDDAELAKPLVRRLGEFCNPIVL